MTEDSDYMKAAIEEAAKSRSEDDRAHPRVGVVVVKNGEILARAHRGEDGPGEHGEFTALEKKLPNTLLAGATVYTTLEPCTSRNHPKVPCAHRLIERKVRRVVIGMLDPNEKICGRGLWHLRESNIQTDLFPHQLMSEIEELNRDFIRTHRPHRRSAETAETLSPSNAIIPKDPEFEKMVLYFTWRTEMTQGNTESAILTYTKLLDAQSDERSRKRLPLMQLQLKAIHARDAVALSSLESACADPELGEFATELHAEALQSVGHTEQALGVLQRAAQSTDNVDAKARLTIKAAQIFDEVGQPELAIASLQSTLASPIHTNIRAQVLTELARQRDGGFSPLVRSALLTRAASLSATPSNMFAAAHSLCEAGLYGLSALQYDFLLTVNPNHEGGLNNLGVAAERLGLPGMSVAYYKRAAEVGNTLAMANLANQYMSVGFMEEADQIIRQARIKEAPHQNVGAAIVALANSRQIENEKWNEIKKLSHRHMNFIHALADAITTTANPQTLIGSWEIGNSITITISLSGMTAVATWEENSVKRRIVVQVFGSALIGTIEDWNYWRERYEDGRQIAMVLRENRLLWGLILGENGTTLPIEWAKKV